MKPSERFDHLIVRFCWSIFFSLFHRFIRIIFFPLFFGKFKLRFFFCHCKRYLNDKWLWRFVVVVLFFFFVFSPLLYFNCDFFSQKYRTFLSSFVLSSNNNEPKYEKQIQIIRSEIITNLKIYYIFLLLLLLFFLNRFMWLYYYLYGRL